MKLIELGHLIKGVQTKTKTKGASIEQRSITKPGPLEKAYKLKELSKLIGGR
jgi:hypothetical protein